MGWMLTSFSSRHLRARFEVIILVCQANSSTCPRVPSRAELILHEPVEQHDVQQANGRRDGHGERVHDGIEPIALNVQRSQTDDDDAEAKENECHIVAHVDESFHAMLPSARRRLKHVRVPAKETSAV